MREFNLLIVEDDDLVVATLRTLLPPSWRLTHMPRLNLPTTHEFHAAMVDLHLTGRIDRCEGIGVIGQLREQYPHLEIVAISGDLTLPMMEKTLQAGANRFLAKPLNSNEIKMTLNKIEQKCILQGLSKKVFSEFQWLGASEAARLVQRQIAELSGEPGPILLEGESGTGKEVVARLLHQQLSSGPFVAVNLGGIPEHLFEAEMFGYIKGAFTGAEQNRVGLIEAAASGTLFLDEIEALPVAHQPKLLRFLESGECRKVGAKDSFKVQTRVVAATNRSLKQMVSEGRFREDLYYRLCGKIVPLPALRDRKEDISLIAEAFLARDVNRKKLLTDEAVQELQKHSWPGNVRELKRVCEQLSAFAPLPLVRAEDVRQVLSPNVASVKHETVDYSQGLERIMSSYETRVISDCLQQLKDIDETARRLQISRSSLYKKIKDYQIDWRTS